MDSAIKQRIKEKLDEVSEAFPGLDVVLLIGDPKDDNFSAVSTCEPEMVVTILLSAVEALGFPIHVVHGVGFNSKEN